MRTSSIINYPVVLVISLAFFFYACEKLISTIEVQSPNTTNSISFQLTEEGTPTYKVKRTLPFKTPSRTIQIGDNTGDLIESNLVANLNEPNKLGDISWF